MTVQVSDRLSQLYVGNGVNTRFDFMFRAYEQEDETGIGVRVKVGNEFEFIDESEYAVTINPDDMGGYVTFVEPPSAETFFYIAGKTPVDQLLDITNYDNFYPDAIERALDKLTAILQEWKHLVDFETQARILADIDYDQLAMQRESELKAYIDGIASSIIGQPVVGLPAKFVIDGDENQEQINDKSTQIVKSRAELKTYKPRGAGQVVFLQSVIEGKNKGAGHFHYNASSIKTPDNGILIASDFGGNWERISMETYHNVQWWGALGDSVDDTDAIWDALNAHGSYTFNNLANPTNASFCSIYLPQSEGTYVITRPIKLLPYMRLLGDSTKGGSLWGNSANWKSVIETRFPLAENYEWAISTMNYVRATGLPTTWDSNYSGNNYDNGIVTGCFGSSVQDIVLVNFDTTKRVYGGIRMQNAPQCSVIDCYVQGFDFCVYSSGSWDSRFDVGTVSYKCGFGCYGDMNNARINGYHHGTKGGLAPMPQQHPTAYVNDSTSGLENYSAWVNYKYGVIVKYAYGFTSQNLIAEYHDVGILFNQCTGTTGAIYTEKNTRGIATVAANVNIGSISGVRNVYSFSFGTGSKVDVGHIVTDNHLTAIRDNSNSQYNSEIIIPTSVNFNGYNVFHKNWKNIVYVSATSGSDINNGLTASTPVATIGKAIDLFLKQRAYDTSVRDFVAGRKRIIILDSSSYTIGTTQALSGDWEIECVNATKATLSWGVAYWALTNAQLRTKNVNLTRAVGNNGLGAYMTGAIISSTGNNTLTIDNADVNINGTYALVSMHNSAKGNLNLDISGGTFTTTDSTAKIVEHLNTATNYLIKYGIVTTLGANLSGRSDKGVDVPTGNVISGIVR
ncbi:hypothetical protein [Acinetobacter oleivorans]|uniref:hypothetical protein n=1 Tax=Acinetobacter oleivorans TaxID=1148157 RepID=UPI001CEFB2AF|nr:hypothetical protein [Acinetobacter oleivorans]